MTVRAHSPLAPVPADDAEGFASLLDKISRDRGFSCGSYKERCLRRRIGVRMRARGVHTFADYEHVLDTDVVEYDRLLDALTINVTKLFRNWEVWSRLAERVVPALWALPDAEIRVWSAGCASGEEPYSIAALFHRHAERLGEAWRADRVRVLASDIDRASLVAAERGAFAEGAFADTPAELRARYFSADVPSTIAPEVRAMVRFERRDLLRDGPPPGAFHLVVCRNVVIYFDHPSQERLFLQFHDALRPDGFLLLGKVETLLGPARPRFVVVDQRERIYRRT